MYLIAGFILLTGLCVLIAVPFLRQARKIDEQRSARK